MTAEKRVLGLNLAVEWFPIIHNGNKLKIAALKTNGDTPFACLAPEVRLMTWAEYGSFMIAIRVPRRPDHEMKDDDTVMLFVINRQMGYLKTTGDSMEMPGGLGRGPRNKPIPLPVLIFVVKT